MKSAERDKVLPITSKDLPKVTVDLSLKAFVRFARGKVLAIPPTHYWCLLIFFGGILISQARKFISPFDFKFVETTKSTPKSLLNFQDAYFAFFPEMAEITMIMICYIQTCVMVLLLQAGVQILLVPPLISGLMLYILYLMHKTSTSGINVACGGSMKLPLFWFITLGVFGLSLIFCSLAFLTVYFIWRVIYEGTSTEGVKDIDPVVLEGLVDIFVPDSGLT